MNAGLAEPAIVNRIRELGAEPMIMSPSELDAFVAADTQIMFAQRLTLYNKHLKAADYG